MNEHTERVYRACIEGVSSSLVRLLGFSLPPVSVGEIKSLMDKQGTRISNRAVRNHLRRLMGTGLIKRGKDGWHLTEKGAKPLRMADALSEQDGQTNYAFDYDNIVYGSSVLFDGKTLTVKGSIKK